MLSLISRRRLSSHARISVARTTSLYNMMADKDPSSSDDVPPTVEPEDGSQTSDVQAGEVRRFN